MAAATYPPIADYAFLTDGHSTGLVSRDGSIDWLCMPRSDSASVFGRVLDWERGGFFSIVPETADYRVERRYLPGTLVLETTFRTDSGEVAVLDTIAMRRGGRTRPHRQVLRIVEGREGEVRMTWHLAPRLEYGMIAPWIRRHGSGVFSAVGGPTGLVVVSDADFDPGESGDLAATGSVHSGDRLRTSLEWRPAHELRDGPDSVTTVDAIDRRFEDTIRWWEAWSERADLDGLPDPAGVATSAMVLKGLTNPTTGAISAAATTSLPEAIGSERNWDYRYSWVRDSVFSVRELADLGYPEVADGFRRFIERSAAGDPADLQVVYGLGGEVRLDEVELPLRGYRDSSPVRIGNAAFRQIQLDTAGYVVTLALRWTERGMVLDEDYWRFLREMAELVCERWDDRDRGIWEVRGEPRHFVHSKVMCWAAIDGVLRIADASGRAIEDADRLRSTRDAIRNAVETRGYDDERGVFVRSFGSTEMDAALLLLPRFGFVDYEDPRMVRTVDAIRSELDSDDGMVRRYTADDGLGGEEGSFVATTFWLAECLAFQGRFEEARSVFSRGLEARNDLGLFGEEFDVDQGLILGNFPQGLSHLAHIGAAMALAGR